MAERDERRQRRDAQRAVDTPVDTHSVELEYQGDLDDDQRFILCDRLEEADDPRGSLLRQTIPQSECRTTPFDAGQPPGQVFYGPVGFVVVPIPVEFYGFRMNGIWRPGDPQEPLTAVIRTRAGRGLFEQTFNPRGWFRYEPPPTEPPVISETGLVLGVSGDGVVEISIPSRGLALIATVFGTVAAFWRHRLPVIFPELTPAR